MDCIQENTIHLFFIFRHFLYISIIFHYFTVCNNFNSIYTFFYNIDIIIEKKALKTL